MAMSLSDSHPFHLRKVDRKLNAPGSREGGEVIATENEERD